MIAIMKKEAMMMLVMPTTYVILALYLFFSSFFIYFSVIAFSTNNLSGFLDRFDLFIALVNPLLAARLISEELRQKTYELLLSSPHSTFVIVLAKYAVAIFFFLLALIVSLLPLFILSTMTPLYWSAVFLGYGRLFLLGATVIAIGLVASSLTESVFLAAFFSLAFSLFAYLFSIEFSSFPGFLNFLLKEISFFSHIESFRLGILSFGDLAYFFFYIVTMLVFSAFLLERRR